MAVSERLTKCVMEILENCVATNIPYFILKFYLNHPGHFSVFYLPVHVRGTARKCFSSLSLLLIYMRSDRKPLPPLTTWCSLHILVHCSLSASSMTSSSLTITMAIKIDTDKSSSSYRLFPQPKKLLQSFFSIIFLFHSRSLRYDC